MSHLKTLNSYTALELRGKNVWFFGLLITGLTTFIYILSWFLLQAPYGISPEHVGGTPLEMAFWLTSFSSAFLAFYVMELLFRSRDVRLLSQLPIAPLDILAFRSNKFFVILALTLFPFAGLFAPVWQDNIALAALCLGVWFFGNLTCYVLSAAVLMYAGNASLAQTNNAAFASSMFTAAPAIALGLSLFANLFLKLLAEALLKPNYANAAITAATIVGVTLIVSTAYALVRFRKRYFAIQANFMDNDRVTLNANYQFVDQKTLNALKTSESIEQVLVARDVAQITRKHTLSRVILITLAIIMAVVAFYSPETMSSIRMPVAALVLMLVLAPVWLWLEDDAFSRRLPVTEDVRQRAKRRAAFRLVLPGAVALTAASLPVLATNTALGLVYLVLTPCLVFGATALLVRLSFTQPVRSRIVTVSLAILAATLCFL